MNGTPEIQAILPDILWEALVLNWNCETSGLEPWTRNQGLCILGPALGPSADLCTLVCLFVCLSRVFLVHQG